MSTESMQQRLAAKVAGSEAYLKTALGDALFEVVQAGQEPTRASLSHHIQRRLGALNVGAVPPYIPAGLQAALDFLDPAKALPPETK